MSDLPLSGTQYRIRAAGYHAEVASVGASLRTLTYGGRDLVVPFRADEVRPVYRGATLAPWPNRVVDGRYVFAGRCLQLPLSEPERGHALHGLVAWLDFHAIQVSETSVQLAATVEPQAGYPWRLLVETTYSLGAAGLTQEVCATNLSDEPAPWGTGPHPYLVAGRGAVDDWSLELLASLVLEVTEDRLAPTRLETIEDGGPFDFRRRRRFGPLRVDHAFTGLMPAADGRITARLTTSSGTGVAMSWDASCPWVQIHTADLPGGQTEAGHRVGLAVEPMTCGPDAFNAHSYDFDLGMIVLGPGDSTSARWTMTAI